MSRVRTGTVVPAAKCGVVRMAKGGAAKKKKR